MKLSELSDEAQNKLTTSPFGFEKDEDIDQLCDGGNAFWYYTDVTPLMYAAYSGDLDLTTELVERGADLNKTDSCFKYTPLLWAAKYGRDKIVEYLLTHSNKDTETAYSVSKKDSYCSIYGFWQRAEEFLGKADYERTRTILEPAHK